MPGNYNCYKCKKAELEKLKSEFDQCLKKIREERKPVRIREDSPIQIKKNKYIIRIYKSLEASVYNQYSSLEKISKKVFKFDEQKLNKILGEEKEKFFSKLKSFQKKLQEDEIKDYWLSMFIRLCVEQKKKKSDNEFIKLFSLNTDDNSVHEILIDILYHGIKEWGDRIEIRNLTDSDKLKKLKNRSMLDEKILFKKIQEKIYERLNDKTILRDQWIMLGIEFLFEFVFNDKNFWKSYYDSTRQLQEIKIMEVSRWMNPEAGICVLCEEKKINKLKSKVSKMICGDKNAIFWYMPENIEDFFEYNFNLYSYYRCYLLPMSIFWRKAERGFFYNSGSTRYFEWKLRLRADVTNIFRQWISSANNQNICMSLYKDVFATIFSVSRRYKQDQLTIRADENMGAYLIRKEGEKTESIFTESVKAFDANGKEKSLKTYFSPLFEGRKNEKEYKNLYRLMKKKNKRGENIRIRNFSVVADELYKFIDGLPEFERYLVEDKVGVLSAWECYNTFYEIYQLYSEDKEMKASIKTLVASIAKVNNLELRLCLIRSIDKIVKDVMMSVQIELKTALDIISEQVEIEVESFNEKYEKILDAAVYLFCEDNKWENIMWIKDTRTEELTRVIKRFEELKASKTEKTYVGRKFNGLYYVTSENHGFFTDIWKIIRSSDGYNVFEKYKVKK